MMTLKNHVKNRARPEACIAHGYLIDETMGLRLHTCMVLTSLEDVFGM